MTPEEARAARREHQRTCKDCTKTRMCPQLVEIVHTGGSLFDAVGLPDPKRQTTAAA